MADSYDVVVIGGGSGGYVSAIRLAQYGRSVAVVERDKLGGTCLHRGCIPTKAFLESAGLLDRIKHAAELGISANGVGFDFSAVAKRKDRIVGANEQGIRGLFRANGVESIPGTGRLDGPTTVVVNGSEGERRITAKNVLLATGSRPKSLPGLAIDGDRVVTSDHVTQWTELPKSIVIVGAGAVGAEFASAMNDFGVETTLVEFLPRVLPLEDAECSEAVARNFTRRGITVLTGTKLLPETLARDGSGVTIEADTGGERRKLAAERLLIATGREAVTDGIGLERTKVRIERGFVQVDGTMRTGEPNVYACGDVIGGLMLAHVAFAEGLAAAAAIAGEKSWGIDYNALPRATYTRPEVASIGLTEEQAAATGGEIRVGRFSFRANPKAMIVGETEGVSKVVADARTGEILGVHLAGPHVTELIGEGVLGKLLEATPLELGLAVHAHPTLSEVIGEAAADVDGRAIHAHKPRRP